jgi:4-amino-4-deoxy-L-arabinose transferase-like glycosyltransferase
MKAMNKPLFVIFLAGALIRLVLWFEFQGLNTLHDDEREYDAIAKNLVEQGEFAVSPGSLTSIRPPLYPAFLVGVYSLAGVENYQAVRFLQAVISLLTVALLYRLGKEVYSQRVGTWLAGLFAFYPSLLGYNNLILTETLFTFLLCLTCFCIIRSLQLGSIPWLAAGGAAITLTALTRSVLWVFPPVLSLFLLIAWKGPLSRRLLAVACLVVAFAITLTPWAIRNTRLHKTLVVIDVMGGRNFMMGNYEFTPLFRSWDAVSEKGDRFWLHEVSETYSPKEMETQGKIDKLALRQGLKFVMAHPGLTFQRDVVKFFDFWGLERELIAGARQNYFGSMPKPLLIALGAFILGAYVFTLFSGIIGMCVVPPADWRAHTFLLLLIVFVTVMHTLVFGHSRYHLPLIPIVLLYSASVCAQARLVWQKRFDWSFRLACGICLLFVAGWIGRTLMSKDMSFLSGL